MIATPRLLLRQWREDDREAFAAMNAHPDVMHDLGGPITRQDSDAKLDRYARVFDAHRLGRWAIETSGDGFIGYAGIMPSRPDHPLGPHHEIGWRLVRNAWGRGYATEAAEVALQDGFARCGLTEVLAYTAADNHRSQAVMARLRLARDPSRDFTAYYAGTGAWSGQVWVADQERPRRR